MIRVYADDLLVYAPELPKYALIDLRATVSATTSGTATIVMPPNHPALEWFTAYKTVVTIYRNNVLLFRGRALYEATDVYNCKTITCEGERGFLNDTVIRPYLYQDSPEAIFSALITEHNAQVIDQAKRFTVGTVTAQDSNDYVRLESGTAERTADVLAKLVERVGGYIVFTTNETGERVINWYADPGYRSGQVIEFGSNLIDYSSTGAGSDMATVIIPYGAADEETGERITIKSVNDGLDYIQDDEAVALRGFIAQAVYWDDVTEPPNLLRKAKEALATKKNIITSLSLSTVDLSAMDKSIDTFRVLDLVRVRSVPHGLDTDFLLTDRSYDLLRPENDTVVLGKQVTTLTGSDVAGDREIVRQVENNRTDYSREIEAARTQLTSKMEQTEQKILQEVAETYTTGDEVDAMISTKMTQTSEGWAFEFDSLKKTVKANDEYARDQFAEQKQYIRFVNGEIHLGKEGNQFQQRVRRDRNSFLDGGTEVAYFSNKKLHVTDGEFTKTLQIGSFQWVPRENHNLSFVKVGD